MSRHAVLNPGFRLLFVFAVTALNALNRCSWHVVALIICFLSSCFDFGSNSLPQCVTPFPVVSDLPVRLDDVAGSRHESLLSIAP